MKFRILSALLRSAWAIDERFALAHGGIVAGLLNGLDFESASEAETLEEKNSLPYALLASTPQRKYSAFDEAPKGSIAIIPVRGPLMKDDEQDCGVLSAGMHTLGTRVMEADQHPNISGIILYIDSPGGTVDGTQAFADKVKACKTPVVTFIDGLMASAALWIGTSASRIIAQNATTEIGSIGVMVQFADMQPMWEHDGVKFHRINADQSRDKNKTYTDALNGDYAGIKNEQLNPLAEQFISAVKANRPNLPDSVFTGKVFFAEDALSLGLIDEIGSLETAISAVSALSVSENPISVSSASTQLPKPILKTMDLPILISLLQVSAIETTDDGVYLNEQQLQAIENLLKDNAASIQSITASSENAVREAESLVSNAEAASLAADSLRIAAEAALANTIASIDEIHPDVASASDIPSKIGTIRSLLAKKPSAAPVGIKSEKDPAVIADGVDWDTLNSLPHMQSAE
jgi:signal peptide peptidase SppA